MGQIHKVFFLLCEIILRTSISKAAGELFFLNICFFPKSDFFLEHLKFSRRRHNPFYKNTSNFRRTKNGTRTHINFPGEADCTIKISRNAFKNQNSAKTHTIFQEEKYHKNRSNFPGELSQNFVRADTISMRTITYVYVQVRFNAF